MDISVHKRIIGYTDNLFISKDKFIKVNNFPNDDSYIVGVSDDDFPLRSADELLKLNGFSVPSFPDKKFVTAMAYVTQTKFLPWSFLMPKKTYINNIQSFMANNVKLLENSRHDYYKKINPISKTILGKLQPCKIHNTLWKHYMLSEENLSIKNALESFSSEDGWTKPIEYSRDTKTGRLKVNAGPQILRLKREYRNILKSRFENGKLYYLDYRSLEPRVTLAINKPNNASPVDIYTHILETLNITTIDRNSIKTIILSQLFGANQEKLLDVLKTVENPLDFIHLISDFFGLEELKQKLITELSEKQSSGRIGFYNYYGRWLDCSDAKPYMFINYYIQSTAVDVAMLGFAAVLKLIENSKHSPSIVPVFILHDALILDVDSCSINFLDELAEAGNVIPGFPNTKFYLDCEPLN